MSTISLRLPESLHKRVRELARDAPMRTYSSGMFARLGFSIATSWKPDILILDEILSVGDENFRNKCRIRIESFQQEGTTTLLVSHNSNNIETMCSRAVWLDHGVIQAEGDVKDVVDSYRQSQQPTATPLK